MTKTVLTGLLLTGIILVSCRSSQKFQASVTADKPLFAAINELNKHPDNKKAQTDLVTFYKQAVERHEEALDAYQQSTDVKRWDKMLAELNSLQHIYNSIQATPGSFSLVRPKNYLKDIEDVKAAAAEDFYNHGTNLLAQPGRENSLEAYNAFKKANSYVSGYKDVNKIMKEAYEKSVINVVINPIEDDNVYFSRWNDFGDFRYRPEEYQQSLVRDLGGRNTNQYAARFYTDREARREDIEADWLVNMRWRNIDPIRSSPQQYSRQASRSVQVGSDTSGKPIYQTVYATVYITHRTFTVRGEIDYRITDLENNSSIDHGYLSDDVYWDESSATYSGDSRALSQEDWRMINNRDLNNNSISRSDILNTLMRKMYPELRRRIQNALN